MQPNDCHSRRYPLYRFIVSFYGLLRELASQNRTEIYVDSTPDMSRFIGTNVMCTPIRVRIGKSSRRDERSRRPAW